MKILNGNSTKTIYIYIYINYILNILNKKKIRNVFL